MVQPDDLGDAVEIESYCFRNLGPVKGIDIWVMVVFGLSSAYYGHGFEGPLLGLSIVRDFVCGPVSGQRGP